MKKLHVTAALAVAATFALSGCSPAEDPNGRDAEAGLDGLTVAFSTPSTQIPFIASMAEIVEERLAEEGVNTVVQDAGFDHATQAQQLEEAATSGSIAGAWIFPVSPKALQPTLEVLRAKNIPAVVMAAPEDFGYVGGESGLIFTVGDYEEYGEAIGEEAATCASREGATQALLLAAPAGAGGASLVTAAITTKFGEGAPKASIVASAEAADPASAQTAVEQLLIDHPEASVVIAGTDETALGAMAAFSKAGRSPDCLIVGGGGDEVVKAQEAGDVTVLVSWDYAAVSEQAGAQLVQMLKDPTWKAPVLITPITVIR